ncbi:MAG: hypothetical protein K0S54_1140 [Alphaproteobacteria bacterium]|jgi:hypothetical protein|nr:hypothetical protein [Alphaproteobacteria bacterium]
MPVIKLAGFTGEAPRVTPRLLPDTGAQIAQSTRLEDGKLSPFRKPFPVHILNGATEGAVKTIYRHLTDWLHWPTVVHAVPGPVAQDRLYYTGDGKPKMRVAGAVYDLAVQAPSTALTAARTGTTGSVTSTVLYVYTWVTSFEEESEPSPVTADLLVSPGNSVTLSGFTAPPSGRAITKQRIYRSQTGTSGGTNLYFIHERAASTANYVDSLALNDFSEPLPSLDWNAPPDGLTGLVSMPNGMMAGFVGKDLYFCEPYRPHAWPQKYVLTTDYDIVALAVYGTTLVVGTKGNPYLAAGTAPESMVMERLELNMPCLNPQGMVDLGYAVAYPSHDGLVVVQGGAARVVTGSLLTRDQWLKLGPSSMVCGQFYGRFFGSYDYIETDGLLVKGSLILDLSGEAPFLIRSQHKSDAFFYEVTSGALYMVMGTTIFEWDSKQSTNDIQTWRSKPFMLPAPTSFGALMFEVDDREDLAAISAAEAANAAVQTINAALFAAPSIFGDINGSMLGEYPVNGDILVPAPPGPQVSVNIYADGDLVASVSRGGKIVRLPGGRLCRQWEVEVTGNIDIQEVVMARTAQELRSV